MRGRSSRVACRISSPGYSLRTCGIQLDQQCVAVRVACWSFQVSRSVRLGSDGSDCADGQGGVKSEGEAGRAGCKGVEPYSETGVRKFGY